MLWCDKCRKEDPDIEIREEEETYAVGKKKIPITTINQITYCKVCNGQIWNEPLEEINLNRAYDKYKEITGEDVRLNRQ